MATRAEQWRAKLAKAQRGKRHSAETRRRIGDAQRGKPKNHGAAISAGKRGKVTVQGDAHGFWKGDAASSKAKQARARRLYSLDGVTCEVRGCKRPAEHRHHVDGDRGNNKRANVQLLCADCHKAIHYGVS